jgi:hypothetical protein
MKRPSSKFVSTNLIEPYLRTIQKHYAKQRKIPFLICEEEDSVKRLEDTLERFALPENYTGT